MLLAWLPLRVLYAIADGLWLVLYYVVRYRRKVTETNLSKALPEKSDQERKKIAKDYYRHLADLLAEALFNLRTTPKQILSHYKMANREVLDRYYEEGQSVILVAAHYNNWEYMVAGLNMLVRHHGVGVGKPLSNKRFGKWITAKRTRYGTEVVDQHDVRRVMDFYNRNRVPVAYMMMCDQSPNDVHKCYWTEFMHQDTGFIYGPEHFARKYNYPVVYYEVKKLRRGYYEVKFTTISERPTEEEPYYITKKYVSLLNDLLHREPQYWLWSHKRWKRKRPE